MRHDEHGVSVSVLDAEVMARLQGRVHMGWTGGQMNG